MDRRLAPRLFDPAEPLVAARPMDMGDDIRLAPGDELPEGRLNSGQCLRLWMTGHVMYLKDYRPTPTVDDIDPSTVVVDADAVEDAVKQFEATAPHEVTSAHIGGGYYLLTPSWDESLAEKVQGKDAAAARVLELLATASPVSQPEGAQGAPEAVSQPDAQAEPVSQPEGASEAAATTTQE